MSRRHGFTMIELLVVITVISILMTILLPVFSRVRESGRRSRCAHNLEQIGHALNLYAEDYRSWYPPTVKDGDDLDSSEPTNQVVRSDGKEIGFGRMWRAFIDGNDPLGFEKISTAITCPSTNYWDKMMYQYGQAPNQDFYCSYILRGGGAPIGGLRMHTLDDRDTLARKAGRFALATDANHRRADEIYNHAGKVNLTLYSDNSVTTKELQGTLDNPTALMYFVDEP
jgi:prepilin-type N-terminal cleavage/methylation domain-containing protein